MISYDSVVAVIPAAYLFNALITLLYTTSKGQKIRTQPQERKDRTGVTFSMIHTDKELMVVQCVAEALWVAPCPALNTEK